jgi:hypothetical protein
MSIVVADAPVASSPSIEHLRSILALSGIVVAGLVNATWLAFLCSGVLRLLTTFA